MMTAATTMINHWLKWGEAAAKYEYDDDNEKAIYDEDDLRPGKYESADNDEEDEKCQLLVALPQCVHNCLEHFYNHNDELMMGGVGGG